MCNQPGRPTPATQISSQTRHKTEFWTDFEFLTRARQHDYRLQYQVVKYLFLSTEKDNADKYISDIEVNTHTQKGMQWSQLCILIIFSHKLICFSNNIYCDFSNIMGKDDVFLVLHSYQALWYSSRLGKGPIQSYQALWGSRHCVFFEVSHPREHTIPVFVCFKIILLAILNIF